MISMSMQPDLLILKLIEKLSDSNPITRRNAAGALRLQGARAVVALPAISALLTDQDSRVRNEAERAVAHLRLGRAGDHVGGARAGLREAGLGVVKQDVAVVAYRHG